MHENTSPVVIQDKNGKITTVHKKNSTGASALGSSLPAPALAKVDPTADARQQLNDLGIDLSEGEYGTKNAEYLARYPKTLHEVTEAIKESDEDTKKYIWEEKLKNNEMHPLDDEDTYNYLNSYLRIVKTTQLGRLLFPDQSSGSLRLSIDRLTLQCEKAMGWWPTSKKYVEVQAAMVAVMASKKPLGFQFQLHMNDIFFMADNWEKVSPLIPAILDRGDTSQGYIKELMENESTALANGLL